MARARKLYCQKHQGFFWGDRLYSLNGVMVCRNCYRSLGSIPVVNTKKMIVDGIIIGLIIAAVFALAIRIHSDDFQKEWKAKKEELHHGN